MIPRRKLLNFTRDFMFSRPLSGPANWMAKRDLIGQRENASGRNLLPADPPSTEQRESRAEHRAPRDVARPMDAEHDPREAVEDDHRRGERPGVGPPARRCEPGEEQIDGRGARRVAARIGKARLMIEVVDPIGPRAAEAELHERKST